MARSRPRKRRSLRTYFRLTLGAVILVGLNYVFTKWFDLLFGNFDAAAFIVDSIFIFGFILFFTVYFWAGDTHGTIARMLGAKEDDD